MTSRDKLRVLLVDDHTLFRKSLATLLSSRADLEVVGDAENGKEAIQMAGEFLPDLILMDVRMPICGGVEAVRAIKKDMPHVKIVMLSAFDDDDDLFAAIKSGADGYLLKNLGPSQFFAHLEGIRRGEAPVSGVLADRVLHEFRKVEAELERSAAERHMLSPREVETLTLLVEGKTNKEIADILCVSETTVKHHLWDVMEKLHLQNRIQLAVYAVRQGLADRCTGN